MSLREALLAVAEPDRAPGMAAYMKNHFPFMGVRSGPRKAAQKPFVAQLGSLDADGLLDAVEALWDERERELQYVGVDALRKHQRNLDASALPRLRGLITHKSWWDTVDLLASRVVGPIVRRHGAVDVMDGWIADDDLWIARTALLHQLGYGADTDQERLFAYCLHQAGHRDFFVRKAIGWALRQHARTAPEAVRTFVGTHRDVLSGLSQREATKHLR